MSNKSYMCDGQETIYLWPYSSTKFLGIHIPENLTWSLNTSSIAKKAQQRLYFLWRLPPPVLTMFYRGTAESFLSRCIIAWFGNGNASDPKTLQQIVRTAEKIIGVSLPSVTDLHTTPCTRKALSIVKDPTQPAHWLSSLLPSGRSVDTRNQPGLEHPHTVPADGAVGVEVEGHQAFWTCDDKPFILVLTTVPPHTDWLVVSTKTKAGLVTEDDPLPF
ncbi:hypothetical protein NFI96_010017 [Prochilodus magdalenae]|nr:hypothetical protein NFI96_010017 [Prochilodus magdalenae]